MRGCGSGEGVGRRVRRGCARDASSGLARSRARRLPVRKGFGGASVSAPRGADRDAIEYARVGELFRSLEARTDLASESGVYDVISDPEVFHEYVSVQTLRADGAEERPPKHFLVDPVLALQDLREGGGRAVDFDGHDEADRQVDAVRSSAVLGELERSVASRGGALQHVPQRRRSRRPGRFILRRLPDDAAPAKFSHRPRSRVRAPSSSGTHSSPGTRRRALAQSRLLPHGRARRDPGPNATGRPRAS